MERNENSSTQTQKETTTPAVYMPGMPSLSIVEALGSKLFRRRGSLVPASRHN
jgi:hypothetical protein